MTPFSLTSTLLAGLCLGGATYAQFPATMELGALDGTDGFSLVGIGDHDHSGFSVACVGDFNGDGVDDVLIGAPNASPVFEDNAGQAYIVFGQVGIGAGGEVSLASLDGQTGIILYTDDTHQHFGNAVSGAGDLNGDGFDDVVVADAEGEGTAYVIFGGTDVAPSGFFDLDTIDGSNGFVMQGFFHSANPDPSVACAGDFNADGYDDVMVGLPESNSKFLPETEDAGEACIVFGGPAVGASGFIQLTDLDGTNGVQIEGTLKFDECGTSVAGLGDFNGDGVDDVLVGAPQPAGGTGLAYVVFGGPGVGGDGHIDVATLDPSSTGFHLKGTINSGRLGRFTGAPGDVNCDGLADLVLGTPSVDFGFIEERGLVYVVFGGLDPGPDAELSMDELNGLNGFTVEGLNDSDFLGNTVAGSGDLNGDDVPDLVFGAQGFDPHGKSSAGSGWVIFGHPAVGSSASVDLDGLDGLSGVALYGALPGELTGVVSRAGDLNDDGVDDLLVAAPYSWDGAVEGVGRTYVIFGKVTPPPVPKAPLVVLPDTLAMFDPIPQKQFLLPGAAYAGRLYWMVGSSAGTSPGFTYDGVHVPLNPDTYLNYTLSHPNSPLLPSSVGFIGADGKALSWFVWPDGFSDLSLVGLELNHAYGLLDPVTGKVDFVSNAAALTIGL